MRYGRADGNQTKIEAALRHCGAFVVNLANVGRGCPDLLFYFMGSWHVAEVKNKSAIGWKWTEAQKKFRKICPTEIPTFYTPEEAVAWTQKYASRETYTDVPF